MNALRMIVIAALSTAITACCAHRHPESLAKASRGYQSSGDEYRFDDGYRLVLVKDANGKLVSARAFNADGNEVKTIIKERRELRLCVPKPEGFDSPECEPLSSMPYGTYFRSGTRTTCYMDAGGYFVLYQC